MAGRLVRLHWAGKAGSVWVRADQVLRVEDDRGRFNVPCCDVVLVSGPGITVRGSAESVACDVNKALGVRG